MRGERAPCACGCGGIPKKRESRFLMGHSQRQPFRYKNYTVEDRGYLSPCWIWLGAVTHGYGTQIISRRHVYAHRAVYELHKGAIPAGLVLDHLCRVTRCVNPDHLEPVTARTNTLRGESIAAANARKTHCLRGHPLSGDNLRIFAQRGGKPGFQRHCHACALQRQRERYQEKKHALVRG